jgi:hypothetical protein
LLGGTGGGKGGCGGLGGDKGGGLGGGGAATVAPWPTDVTPGRPFCTARFQSSGLLALEEGISLVKFKDEGYET